MLIRLVKIRIADPPADPPVQVPSSESEQNATLERRQRKSYSA